MAPDSSGPLPLAGHRPTSKTAPALGSWRSRLYASWFVAVLWVAPAAFAELSLAVSPGAFVYVTFAVFALCFHYALFGKGGVIGRAWAIQMAIVAVALATLHGVAWNSRKAFLLRFSRIEPGMSNAQVEDLLACCSYDARAPKSSPTPRGFHHSRAPRFDSDVGIVHFENGLVTRREFLPD